MKTLKILNKKVLILLLIQLLFALDQVFSYSPENLLTKARRLFYQSIQDDDKIESAISLFQKLYNQEQDYQGRALTYIGTLYALKGKHSFWPHNKFRWVLKGLKLMDQGIRMDPDDIEALFIHGSTCYYLPFFFERKDDAQKNFKRILELLQFKSQQYDPVLLSHVIEFIELHVKLNEKEIKTIRQLKEELKRK